MSEVGDSILRGLEQALAIVKGEADPSTYRIHYPKVLDVRAIRARTGLTQEMFAQRFGFSVDTLRQWEQGKRHPRGPSRSYLKVIDKDPEAVIRALRAA